MELEKLKIGAFGTGNFGDDLMLQAILEKEPNSNVVAYGPPKLPYDVRYIPIKEFMRKSAHYISMSNGVDFGGGNLFWSLENLTNMLILSQQSKIASLPVRLQRIGLQGFEVSELYTKMLLSVVDTITVRDSESLRIAKRLGREDCRLVLDYAYDLKIIKQNKNEDLMQRPRRVGINFSDWRLTSTDSAHKNFAGHILGIFSEIARIFKDRFEFYYIPFCLHSSNRIEDDLLAGALFWESSAGLIQYCEGINTTNDLVSAVASMDVLLGKRFHMQVLGNALKKTVIPMVVDIHESSKFAAISKDHSTDLIPYEGVSQAFIIELIKNRLNMVISN